MKRLTCIILVLGIMLILTSCKENDAAVSDKISGRTYVWEKEGFGGDFTITLNKDGTYEYYEGVLSSYIGSGDWSVKDGVLTLTEKSGYDFVFRFKVKDGELVFVSEGSSQFMYVTVEDGDVFRYKTGE